MHPLSDAVLYVTAFLLKLMNKVTAQSGVGQAHGAPAEVLKNYVGVN